MYLPTMFKEDRLEHLHGFIRASGLATLVTRTSDGLIASHVPMLLETSPVPYGTLIGHLARPNPQARGALGEALAIFQGPDAYITPSWYATKRTTGKVVPTWNYVAVHAFGAIEFFDDPVRLLDVVTHLTDRQEGRRGAPWAVSDAPEEFIQGMLKGIVGFAIAVARLEGKWKMSQNRPVEDRVGVVAGLSEEGQDAVATLVDGATRD